MLYFRDTTQVALPDFHHVNPVFLSHVVTTRVAFSSGNLSLCEKAKRRMTRSSKARRVISGSLVLSQRLSICKQSMLAAPTDAYLHVSAALCTHSERNTHFRNTSRLESL
jgi:hypothetical protein